MLPTNNPYVGTLGMPKMWQRWFDALRNAGVDKLSDQSVGVDEGMFPGPQETTSTIDPYLPQLGRKEALARLQRPSSALQGLTKFRSSR